MADKSKFHKWMTERRFGVFRVSVDILMKEPTLVAQRVFSRVAIMSALTHEEFRYIEYMGASSLFTPLPNGAPIPLYTITIKKFDDRVKVSAAQLEVVES